MPRQDRRDAEPRHSGNARLIYDGRLIRERRLRAGLTQQELADRIGRPTATVALFEANEVIPALGPLGAMATALGCRTDDLYDSDNPDDPVTKYAAELAALVAAAPPLTSTQLAEIGAVVRGATS